LADSVTAGTDERRSIAYRGLLAAVIILGVLIVIALGTLVIGLVMRFSGHPTSTATPYVPPPGARLVAMETSGDRLVLHLRTTGGEEVDIVDLESGRSVARISFPAVR